MKLAEALINRADIQKRLAQVQVRLQRVAKIQEGEQPAEDPNALLAELSELVVAYRGLVQRINRTNSVTVVAANKTLTDVLAERDALALERNALDNLIKATVTNDFRYSRAEIRAVVTLDIAALQKRIDGLARQYRELDTSIQQLNWSVDLVD